MIVLEPLPKSWRTVQMLAMESSSPPPPPPPLGNPNPKSPQWRYTWETLAHIPVLRLYLFRPAFDPSAHCAAVAAALRLDQSLLIVSWSDSVEGEEFVVRVPVPRVLIDPICPVDCRARSDHIEVKLALLLPVDHPAVAGLRGVLDLGKDGVGRERGGTSDDGFLPLSLDSDFQSLSDEGVHLFCKTCSMKLTRKPLRHFLEMPSVNWQDVADNWFGGCCCSFGGISEKLVSAFIESYDCAEGTCLVDATSVIVYKDDLEGYTFEQHSNGDSGLIKVDLAADDNVTDGHRKDGRNDLGECISDIGSTLACAADKGERVSGTGKESSAGQCDTNPVPHPLLSSPDCCGSFTQRTDSFSKRPLKLAQLSSDETQSAVEVDLLKRNSNHCSGVLEKSYSKSANESSSGDHCNCCFDESKNLLNCAHGRSSLGGPITRTEAEQFMKSSQPQKTREWLQHNFLRGGFMVRASNLTQSIRWVEFLCRQCSSLIGSYPCSKSTCVPVDDGLRLFKCYVSTGIPVGGPHDIFRKHTLQRVFVNSILESAEDELSFRTIVRDLETKLPMLQLVLVSSKAWFSTGNCFENVTMGPLSGTDLQPSVKVLFSDCNSASESNSRMVKDWSDTNHAEEVYMLKHQIEELTKYLNSAMSNLPLSCSSLQGMYLSYLDR